MKKVPIELSPEFASKTELTQKFRRGRILSDTSRLQLTELSPNDRILKAFKRFSPRELLRNRYQSPFSSEINPLASSQSLKVSESTGEM